MQRVKRRRVGMTLDLAVIEGISTDDSYLRFGLDLGMARIRSMWSFASFRPQIDAPN